MNEEKNDAAGAEEARPDQAAASPEPSVEERLAALEAEFAQTKDRLLRALAEAENVRRRAQREAADAARYGISTFAKDMLNVADNLRRALESVPPSRVEDDLTRNLLAGVAATERELLAAFERHGIRRLDPAIGERFDHDLHQAMFEVENTGQAAGSIVQVLQPGYMIHDRLLRPAMVAVAKVAPGAIEPPRRVDEVV